MINGITSPGDNLLIHTYTKRRTEGGSTVEGRSSDSATGAVQRGLRSASAPVVSSGSGAARNPISRPVARSVMAAAVQAQAWWVRTVPLPLVTARCARDWQHGSAST